jgi:hypothetical protein
MRGILLWPDHDKEGNPLSFWTKATGAELLEWVKGVLGRDVLAEILRTVRVKSKIPKGEPDPEGDLLYFVRKKDTQFFYLSEAEQRAFSGASMKLMVKSGRKPSGSVYVGKSLQLQLRTSIVLT